MEASSQYQATKLMIHKSDDDSDSLLTLKPLWWWLPCDIKAKIFISKHDAESMTDRKTSCCDAIILDAVIYAL